MDFAFSWEFPATVIGAIAVFAAGIATVVAIARAHHGPSRGELLFLGVVALSGLLAWNTRSVLAQRFFPDVSGVLEDSAARGIANYRDCAAFVAAAGRGVDDGATCTVRVLSTRGRYVASTPPRKSFESPCDHTFPPEVRLWSFTVGSLRDWCSY